MPAGEPSGAADLTRFPRMPDLKELRAMTDHFIAAGFSGMEEPAGTSTVERPQPYDLLFEGNVGRARLLREMSGAKSPQTIAEMKKSAPPEEIDIFAAIEAGKSSGGIGEKSRPRREAANIFRVALYEGNETLPTSPSFLRNLSEAPWGMRGPTHNRAVGAEFGGDWLLTYRPALSGLPPVHRCRRNQRR